MAKILKKRQRAILQALKELGDPVTTMEVAQKLNMNVNGISQSLSALAVSGYVQYIIGGKEDRWALVPPGPG